MGKRKFVSLRTKIRYTKEPCSLNSLGARYISGNSAVKADAFSSEWYFDEQTRFNLKGTTRTLNNVNGVCELENGIMSKSGVTVLDDGQILVIAEDGWEEPGNSDGIDQYLFSYGIVGEQKFNCLAALKKLLRTHE